MRPRTVALVVIPLAALGLAACSPDADAPSDPSLRVQTESTISAIDNTGTPPASSETEAIFAQGGRIAPYPGPPTDALPECESIAWVDTWREDGETEWQREMYGVPVDTGPTEMATGSVETNAAGTPIAYTVADGDAVEAIGGRFCLDYVNLSQLNDLGSDHSLAIHPGDRLVLIVDPAAPIIVGEP